MTAAATARSTCSVVPTTPPKPYMDFADMRLTLRTLAALLGYPSAELLAHIDDLRDALDTEAARPEGGAPPA